jgi:hypothetical protein
MLSIFLIFPLAILYVFSVPLAILYSLPCICFSNFLEQVLAFSKPTLRITTFLPGKA